MDVGTMILLTLLALTLLGGAKAWRLRHEWAAFQAWRAAGMPEAAQAAQDSPGATETLAAVSFDPTPLAGAGHALKHPPATIGALISATKAHGGRYRFPLGWITSDIVTVSFIEDVNHILITGQNNAGKDNAAMGMALTLAITHTPADVQFCIIDGKGLDWRPWENKAHCWRLAWEPKQIRPAMEAISAERERRGRILGAAGVVKWDEYQGGDLPLLVVFISELSLLEDATKPSELAAWLNTELSAGRAFGIRYIVATQNASNFSTRWRSQIGLFLAGFQTSRAADEPNTNMTTSEIEQAGGIPPSKLPAAGGVFTAIHERQAVTLRTSLLPSQHRIYALNQLPDRAAASPPATPRPGADQMLLDLLRKGQELPIEPVTTTGAIAHQKAQEAAEPVAVGGSSSGAVLSVSDDEGPLVVAPEIVPAEEQRRILAAASQATSRRQVSLKLYEATGGQKYDWVKFVCDAAGLLPVKGGAQ